MSPFSWLSQQVGFAVKDCLVFEDFPYLIFISGYNNEFMNHEGIQNIESMYPRIRGGLF